MPRRFKSTEIALFAAPLLLLLATFAGIRLREIYFPVARMRTAGSMPGFTPAPTPVVPRLKAVRISPNGKLIATADKQGNLKWWNARDGKLDRVLAGAKGTVEAIDFSPDGRYFVAAGSPQVRLFDGKSGRFIATGDKRPKQHSPFIVRMTSRGEIITSGSGGVRVWEVKNAQVMPRFGIAFRTTFGLGLSPDERRIVVCGDRTLPGGKTQSTISCWDLQTRKEVWRQIPNSTLSRCIFLPNGRVTAWGGLGPVILDEETGQMLDMFMGRDVAISSDSFNRRFPRQEGMEWMNQTELIYHPPSHTLMGANGAHFISFWGLDRKNAINWSAMEGTAWSETAMSNARAAVSPDGNLIALAAPDATLTLWDMDGVKLPTKVKPTRVPQLIWQIDGKVVLAPQRASGKIVSQVKLSTPSTP